MNIRNIVQIYTDTQLSIISMGSNLCGSSLSSPSRDAYIVYSKGPNMFPCGTTNLQLWARSSNFANSSSLETDCNLLADSYLRMFFLTRGVIVACSWALVSLWLPQLLYMKTHSKILMVQAQMQKHENCPDSCYFVRNVVEKSIWQIRYQKRWWCYELLGWACTTL